MRENRLRRFGNVYKRPKQAIVKRTGRIQTTTTRKRGRSKRAWIEAIRNDLIDIELNRGDYFKPCRTEIKHLCSRHHLVGKYS